MNLVMCSPLSVKVWFLIWILFDLCVSATDPGTDTWCTVDPKNYLISFQIDLVPPHMTERNVWDTLKKRRKISMLIGIREKNVCQRAWIKERNKDSPYFQIKGIPPKGRVMIKWVQKYLRIRKIIKIPHTCTSWSKCMTWISLDPVFDLARDVMQVCLNFLPTQNSTKKPLMVGWKEGKISNALVMFYTHWVIEWIIWGTYIFLQKLIKTSG
jgi:hypothetical protein